MKKLYIMNVLLAGFFLGYGTVQSGTKDSTIFLRFGPISSERVYLEFLKEVQNIGTFTGKYFVIQERRELVSFLEQVGPVVITERGISAMESLAKGLSVEVPVVKELTEEEKHHLLLGFFMARGLAHSANKDALRFDLNSQNAELLNWVVSNFLGRIYSEKDRNMIRIRWRIKSLAEVWLFADMLLSGFLFQNISDVKYQRLILAKPSIILRILLRHTKNPRVESCFYQVQDAFVLGSAYTLPDWLAGILEYAEGLDWREALDEKGGKLNTSGRKALEAKIVGYAKDHYTLL